MARWPQSLKTVLDLILAMPGPATLLWGSSHIQLYNDAYVAIAQHRHPALLGRPVAEGWPDAYEAVILPLLEAARAGRSTRLADYVVGLRDANGRIEERVFDTDWSPVLDETGAVAGALQTLTEGTERLRAERALRESEARHRLLIESWAQAVWETDPDGVVVADSPSWRAFTGQTVDEWLGYGWVDAIHPEDRAVARRQWREAVAAKSLVDAEFRLRSPDGGYRWTNVRAASVINDAGQIEKWVGMNVAIEERKRAEAALRESEERYRALFESMDEGVVTLDVMMDAHGKAVDATYVENNAAFSRMTGLTIDIVGKRLREIFPNLEPFWFEALERIVATGEPERFEHTVHDLEDKWFDCFASRVGGEGSSRIVVVFNNITTRKRTEALLRESEERQAFLLELSDALRPLGDPIAIMATAATLTGRHLGLDRCFYGEVDSASEHVRLADSYCAQGVPPFPDRIRLDDFGEELVATITAGATLTVEDIHDEPRLADPAQIDRYLAARIRAFVGVPLVKGGRLVAILSAHQSSARHWTHLDIGLLEEVAERTWAAVGRARAETALRESEERFRQFAEASASGLWIRNADTLAMEYISPAVSKIYGVEPEAFPGEMQYWAAHIVPEDRDAALKHIERALRGEAAVHEFRIRRASDGVFRWIRNTDFPLLGQGSR
jgi:PAS domain S-box-containing protein